MWTISKIYSARGCDLMKIYTEFKYFISFFIEKHPFG